MDTMNPQHSEISASSLSQPLAALAVAASETAPNENDSDEEACPSTENSSDRSHHSPAFEENPSLNMLQLSTFLAPNVSPTVASFVAQSAASAELKQLQFDNGSCGTKTEGEGEVEDDRKREREHKKRSKNWTRLETLKLIKERTDLDERFRKSGRKVELWDEIAQALQRDSFSRDGQQCKDKWEKLTAGYKEVRDGTRDKEDHPFYDELHQLLSWKSQRRESGLSAKLNEDAVEAKELKIEFSRANLPRRKEEAAPSSAVNASSPIEQNGDKMEETAFPKKRKRASDYVSLTNLAVVQDLLETVITRQQRFFRDLLDAVERKEQLREQIRHEKEEKWRAEERAQRCAFHNAMIVLTQRLLGERPGAGTAPVTAPMVVLPEGHLGPKKRSKNWKRTEVLQLIKLRKEMEGRFAKSTRRAALWEELGEKVVAQGIKRDGKQCREKWDKLMAEFKDVTDGRKDQGESPYFAELTAFLGRPGEAGAPLPQEGTKEEVYVDI